MALLRETRLVTHRELTLSGWLLLDARMLLDLLHQHLLLQLEVLDLELLPVDEARQLVRLLL